MEMLLGTSASRTSISLMLCMEAGETDMRKGRWMYFYMYHVREEV
jgi:hypothetical protein